MGSVSAQLLASHFVHGCAESITDWAANTLVVRAYARTYDPIPCCPECVHVGIIVRGQLHAVADALLIHASDA